MGPLIRIRDLRKVYGTGETEFEALKSVNLDIHEGDFVAIVGSSGSGKSTLMNLLGCLDTPTSGSYEFRGRKISEMAPDELSVMRRTAFGFVFQQYNLVGNATARENVEVPAIYAGVPKARRQKRAADLLGRLGLGKKLGNRPSELSGGQQQRVSIARALMNGADVILADEPTGALDSQSSREVLSLLKNLHASGKTIILITHDPKVASEASRQIEIADGEILSDSSAPKSAIAAVQDAEEENPLDEASGGLSLYEASAIALKALRSNFFRTILTLLGIVIGVASVIVMLAVGEGAKEDVISRFEGMGSNLLVVRAGAPGIRGSVATLVAEDAVAIANLPTIAAAVPELQGSLTVKVQENDIQTSVMATNQFYVDVQNWPVAQGRFLTANDLESYAPVVVLGETVARSLFPDNPNPLGEWIVARNIPLQVIGVLSPKGASSWGQDRDDVIIVPLTTGQLRLIGQRHLRSITVQVEQGHDIKDAEQRVDRLMLDRHQTRDFRIRNMEALIEDIEATQNTLTLMLGTIAAVSLLVGGIGVMNIMLVSVSERTREIGVRMAVGARRKDILSQFLVESMIVCAIGSVIGIVLSLGAGHLISMSGTTVSFSVEPFVFATLCSLFIGLVFGLMPARRASRLNPVIALGMD